MPSIQTRYGKKRPGTSQFVIIAPHGAGDDAKTGVIADRLARKLHGFFILNNVYKKPTNKHISNTTHIEDFNDLSWGHSYGKYLWKKKVPDMKVFYQDIANYCDQAALHNTMQKAITIYIHGMYSTRVAIDIGAGARKLPFSNTIVGTKRHGLFHTNKGGLTMPISFIKKMRLEILANIKKHDDSLAVTVGKHHPGWSKQSAIQFHKHGGRDDYAMQIEISHIFRQNNDTINYIVDIIKNSLKKTFI